MISTSTSLLARLRTGDETQAWSRFVRLYTPVLFYWVRRQGVSTDDPANLVQEVFTVLAKITASFDAEPIDAARFLLAQLWGDQITRAKLPLRASLGSLSEAATVFDAERLKEIIAELGAELKPLGRDARLKDIEQTLTWRGSDWMTSALPSNCPCSLKNDEFLVSCISSEVPDDQNQHGRRTFERAGRRHSRHPQFANPSRRSYWTEKSECTNGLTPKG